MVKSTADKGLRASFVASKKVRYLGRVTPKVYLQLFDSFVLSVLEYASEIWSQGKELLKIERIQLRFFKHMLGVKDSTSTLALYSELGRFPLHLQRI